MPYTIAPALAQRPDPDAIATDVHAPLPPAPCAAADAPAAVAAPGWQFDEPKLRRLLREADDTGLVLREASARRRLAYEDAERARAAIEHARSLAQPVTEGMQQRLAAAAAEVARAVAEVDELETRARGALAVARSCRTWAEARGWSEFGPPNTQARMSEAGLMSLMSAAAGEGAQ